jgi:hypothetical protein
VQGIQGIQGVQGVPGEAGAGVEIAGHVATYLDLPDDLTLTDAGNGYLVEADGLLYVWSGTAFPANGAGTEFRGPAGARGAGWFWGSGAPTTVSGSQIGDLYLDVTTGDVYTSQPD